MCLDVPSLRKLRGRGWTPGTLGFTFDLRWLQITAAIILFFQKTSRQRWREGIDAHCCVCCGSGKSQYSVVCSIHPESRSVWRIFLSETTKWFINLPNGSVTETSTSGPGFIDCQIPAAPTVNFTPRMGLYGWSGSLTADLTRWFGFTTDFSGSYSNETDSITTTVTVTGSPCT